MDTHFKYLLTSLNYRLKQSPLFFITIDPERALGLERILENFHIISLEHNDITEFLSKNKFNVFSLEQETNQQNLIYRSSAKLLEQKPVQDYIKRNSKKEFLLQTFKISPNFERVVEEIYDNAKILNTSSKLNKLFEEKISQFKLLNQKNIRFPKTIITILEDATYLKLRLKLGKKFVIQFNRGHTGNSTFFIDSKEKFKKIQTTFPKRIARISRFINGLPYTVNCVVTKKSTLIGGLSFQITGVKELTNKKGGTIGNDFSFRSNIDEKILKDLKSNIENIGNILRKNGYLGLFGVDFITNGQKIYIIEINARQPASIPFYTKLQLLNKEIPLSLVHLTEFLNIDNEINAEEYNRKNLEPIQASQVFLRNTEDVPFVVNGKVKTGIYRLRSGDSAYKIVGNHRILKDNVIFLDEEKDKPLIFEKEGITIDDIDNGGMIILTKPYQSRINTQEEIGRIQLKQGIIDKNQRLYKWVLESLLAIKSYMR